VDNRLPIQTRYLKKKINKLKGLTLRAAHPQRLDDKHAKDEKKKP
jgi:hypothetical protein